MQKKKSLEFKVQVFTHLATLFCLIIISLFGTRLFNQNLVLFSSLLVILLVSVIASGFFIEAYIDAIFPAIDEPDYFKKHGEMLIPSKSRVLKEKKYFNKTKWFFLIFINLACFIPISLWSVGIFDDIIFNLSKAELLLKVLLIFLLSNFLGTYLILRQRIFLLKLIVLLSIALVLPAVLLVYSNL